ncbi:hypothetical protein THRCLA_11960 [Thraustotheca clavata]|uniref:Uncharacterized protein n=1 Tax=Thraustotheca clavata TaxID=74557 RepID=A0A1V9Y4L1_9STRA|nr:hypothetical protein THRCLA_11960 [Thraustotheca clavata]
MDDNVVDNDILSLVNQLDLPAMDRDLDNATTTRSIKKTKRVRVNTMLRELHALRDQEANLQIQLIMAQTFRTTNKLQLAKQKSKWGRLAIQQYALKLKALRENHELHVLLAEQHAYRLHMESIILKRSRTAMMKLEPEKWRALTLGIHRDARIAAIHAIADRQFDLVESQMIVNGLVDPKEDVFIVRSLNDRDHLCSEGVRYTTLDMNLDSAVRSVMEVMKARNALVTTNESTIPRVQSHNLIFPIDDNTIYVQEQLTHPINQVQVLSNMITKRYAHVNQVTIIWRSVLNDEIGPDCSKGFINDECGW